MGIEIEVVDGEAGWSGIVRLDGVPAYFRADTSEELTSLIVGHVATVHPPETTTLVFVDES